MRPDEIDYDNLTFSFTETKSMYVSRCKLGGNWEKGQLIPFDDIKISPAATILNYGQGLFEGMKAYRTKNNEIIMFRPEENAKRAANGCLRLSMPEISENVFLDGVLNVVKDNIDYIPNTEKGALYVRPIIFGSGEGLGVAHSSDYTFMVYCSPVGPYFKGGLAPIKLIVTNDYHRAPLKGTGGVKAVGNYVPGMLPSGVAKKQGYAEVIYLDAAEEKYIEEVGAANFFAIFGNKLVTPKLTGSILPGITRDSVLFLAKNELKMEVEERRISIDEVMKADEIFCAGTAAIISPIGSIRYINNKYYFSGGKVCIITNKLYYFLTDIQFGNRRDDYGWIRKL